MIRALAGAGALALMVISMGLAAQAPVRSPQRIAVERCVWEAVQQRLRDGARADDIDARLAIGRQATGSCHNLIRHLAETSPAVTEIGDPVDAIELALTNHYVARGALFADGTTQPFHLGASTARAQD